MNNKRIVRMYGDKAVPCFASICVLFFGAGWLCAKYGKMGIGNVLPRILLLFVIIHFADAIIKSLIFMKNNFNLTLTTK